MFLPGLPGLGRCTFILDNLLQSFMPDIAKHLVRSKPTDGTDHYLSFFICISRDTLL
jgi:hypothetical protein